MGYNYHSCGNIRQCAIHNNHVLVRDPFGRETSFLTGLSEEIDWQCNLFWNSEISFLLYTNDKREVIGRPDGSISIYSGNLLVGMNSWSPDNGFALEHIGYGIALQLHRIMLDVKDRRTIFLEGVRYEALLPKEFLKYPDTTAALATIEREERKQAIVLVGGELVEIPVWSIQNDLRIGACRSIV